MNRFAIFSSVLLISLSILSSGCATAIVGGAATGAAVVHDRRTTGVIIDDQEIELKAIRIKYNHPEITEKSNISVTSYNLTVLLTGEAESQQPVDQLAGLISRLPRVKKVVNQVVIGAESTLTEKSNDYYITSRAKVALFDIDLPDFDPTRVKVVTSGGTVHLMGLVTRQEAQAATDKIRYISGVKRVVKAFEYLD